jgi:hypothetical protein
MCVGTGGLLGVGKKKIRKIACLFILAIHKGVGAMLTPPFMEQIDSNGKSTRRFQEASSCSPFLSINSFRENTAKKQEDLLNGI